MLSPLNIYPQKRINCYTIMRVFALTDFVPRVCPKGRLPQDVYDWGFPEGKGTERSINPGGSPGGIGTARIEPCILK